MVFHCTATWACHESFVRSGKEGVRGILSLTGWRLGSMVRMSVFGWHTVPDLWLTCDQFVCKVSAVC